MSRPPARRIAFATIVAAICLQAVVPSADAETDRHAATTGIILVTPDAEPLVQLAAREVQRYVYVRTGELLPIRDSAGGNLPASGTIIAIAAHDRLPSALEDALENGGRTPVKPPANGYALHIAARPGGRLIVIRGGDAVNTLYGAYELAEQLGVRFYLHGDTIPDGRATLADLPAGRSIVRQPIFTTRGIQPFHDFPEGPDVWSLADYQAVLAQLPKLRMNFIGLHTYPEGGPYAEPTVWIGPPEHLADGTAVKGSYPATWFNTIREGWNWGYGQMRTSDYLFGADQLFARDAYCADVMESSCPQPQTPAACNELFDRAGRLLRDAFTFAHRLGIRTCLGTETPLTVPAAVRERLAAQGVDPADPNTAALLYRGIFERVARAYPVDYYWLWTPEGWTWGEASEEQIEATVRDLKAALAAHAAVDPPFELATCGWVLGPQTDRALFDNLLPKSSPMSCINRQVGFTPVPVSFSEIKGRPKWAIPWLEDDQALTTPQLWVGRMRRDAVDARAYGCSGLLGIHWRTREIGPNVAALARAAWSQDGFDTRQTGSGALDGSVAEFGPREIAGTDDDVLYQTVRWGLTLYRIAVPPGDGYTVTLHFSESHFAEPNRRVFDVKLQGQTVIASLDILAAVGRDAALVRTFEPVAAPHGAIDITFTPRVENPLIAAIEVERPGTSVKINCAGPAYEDFEADRVGDFRFCPTDDFYADWCRSQFGEAMGKEAAALFTRLDGRLPRPAGWVGGPGGIGPDARPWADVAAEYAFVDEFAVLRPRVQGAASAARFDYWLNEFRYLRGVARIRCAWGALDAALEAAEKAEAAEEKRDMAQDRAVPRWRALLEALVDMHAALYATVTSPGALGTVVNWQQHILPNVVHRPRQRLEALLGEALADDLRPPTRYAGPPRLIVPTVPGSVAAGEALTLRVLWLAEASPREAVLCVRRAGDAEFAVQELEHVARGVYTATVPLPPAGATTASRDAAVMEYFVRATPAEGEPLFFPPAAPEQNQTLVVMPE